jgi:RNA polymerase sigma-70 factor (ECF subfamily)
MAEMAPWQLDPRAAERLHRDAKAAQWGVSIDTLARAIERGVRRVFGDEPPDAARLARHLDALHLTDLALACACSAGHEAAWEHFVREYRPVLYRAAGALDPTGTARDLADALHAELFGLSERDGVRRSHFDYFHGRSSLSTWLRAVLAQRFVDRTRAERRVAPLPEDESPAAVAAPSPRHPEHARFVTLLRSALVAAIGRLDPRGRLRLACYYAQGLTLAQIGRALGEHEATVSRQLARARTSLREDVERQLRESGLNDDAVAECFAAVAADAGPLDLAELLGPESKNPVGERSTS